MSKTIVMTPQDGKTLIDGMKAKLKEYALDSVVMVADEASALNLRDAATLIRDSVLEFEDKRLAAGRKPPKVATAP